jgi:DNA repair exonuclease SbcCD nuclease subunit
MIRDRLMMEREHEAMKRLFISDLHLHTWAYGATVNNAGYNSRLAGQTGALREVLDYIEKERIKYLYFNGDLFHTHGRVPVQALTVASGFFRKVRQLGTKVRGIYGNHDMESKDGRINSVEPILTDDELFGDWEDAGLRVLALPYTEDEETIKRFLGNASQGAMLMLHQGVMGVPLSSGYVIDEKLTPEMIPSYCKAFTGHYHFHRVVSDRLTVIGNLTPLNWSDIDQPKGFVVWDDETKEPPQQIIQTSAPKFVSWSNETAEEFDLANIAGAFVRYVDEAPMKDQQKIREDLIKEGAWTVEFVKTETEAREIRHGEAVTVEHLVKAFEADDMEPRRRAVGQEIRETRYETPTA